MKTDVGSIAGKIYQALESEDGRSMKLADLKKKVKDKGLDYALGWLLREDKIDIKEENKKVIICLI